MNIKRLKDIYGKLVFILIAINLFWGFVTDEFSLLFLTVIFGLGVIAGYFLEDDNDY